MSFSKGVFCFVLIYNYSVLSTEHNTIKGLKVLCGTHAPHLVNVTCKFKRVNRTTEYWSFDGYYGPTLNTTNNLFVNLNVFSRQQNLQWRPHMIINYHIDLCKWLDGTMENKFLDILFNDLKKAANFIHPCPHIGHFYLRNMTYNDQHFPPIVPPADIYIDFQVFTYIDAKIQKLQYFRPYLEVKTKGILYFK